MKKLNISVIGAGNVGRTITKELIDQDMSMEIDVLDPAPSIEAICSDLKHSASYAKKVSLSWNENKLNSADYIFVCFAEEATVIGDRLAKAEAHIKACYEIFDQYKPKENARIIVITNPVDVITYHVWKASGLDEQQIIGTGTYLETMRFDYYLSQIFNKDISQVRGMLLGEHGNSAVTTYSLTRVEGIDINNAKDKIDAAAEQAIEAPYNIRRAGEYTKYAISKCALGIFKALELNEKLYLPAGLILNEKNQKLLECDAICLSTPVIIENGIPNQGDLSLLTTDEISKLKASAKILMEHSLNRV